MEPSELRVLITADVDNFSTSLLSEKFVKTNHGIDCIIACGPLFDYNGNSQTPEENAIAEVCDFNNIH